MVSFGENMLAKVVQWTVCRHVVRFRRTMFLWSSRPNNLTLKRRKYEDNGSTQMNHVYPVLKEHRNKRIWFHPSDFSPYNKTTCRALLNWSLTCSSCLYTEAKQIWERRAMKHSSFVYTAAGSLFMCVRANVRCSSRQCRVSAERSDCSGGGLQPLPH